jgi:hypothetical protein
VRFEAKAAMRVPQEGRLAAHDTSRIWEMRTRDLEAWKKELEFCRLLGTIDQLMERGSTWRSNEKGRHDLNVVFASMPSIND